MSEAEEYLEWKRNFSWSDDGLHAFLSIKKVNLIFDIVTAKKEGWEDDLEAALAG